MSRVRRRAVGLVATVAIAVAVVALAVAALARFDRRAGGSPAASPSSQAPSSQAPSSQAPSSQAPSSQAVVPPADGGYAERLEQAMAGLPVGAGSAYDVIVGSTLHRAGGGQVQLPARPDMVIVSAVPASGSWLVTYRTDATSDLRYQVVLVAADGSATDLGTGHSGLGSPASVAVTADGTRAAVQVSDGTGSRVSVVDLPSGRELARTELPGGSLFRAAGWAGGAVVLSERGSDLGALAVDIWDPSRGAFVPDKASHGALRFLGRYGSDGAMLAVDASDCLAVVTPAADFAVHSRRCGLGAFVSSSPDGQRLFRLKDGPPRTWETLDTATALAGGTSWVTLGAPAGTDQPRVWSEGPAGVLVAVAVPGPDQAVPPEHWLNMVRCPLDGASCERVPMPPVAPGTRAVLVYPY